MIKNWQILLIFIPAILVVLIAFGIRAIQYEPLYPKVEEDKNAVAELSIPIFGEDPILGKKSAPITIISFEDFGCQSCADQMKLIRTLLTDYSEKVKFIFKGLPVTRVPLSSKQAHAYGYCANTVGQFDKFEELAFKNSTNLSESTLEQIVSELGIGNQEFRNCLNSSLPADYNAKIEALATSLNIQSVPTIFVNGKQIQNPKSISQWKLILGLE